MAQYTFETVLKRPEGVGTWTYFDVPPDAKRVFGAKARVQVKGTIDGVRFRSSLLPSGTGEHYMVVNGEIREEIGKSAGDRVKVAMELDGAPREIAVPGQILRHLRKNKEAYQRFVNLSYSHKKEYLDWVENAKKEETKGTRLEKMVEMLLESRTLKKK